MGLVVALPLRLPSGEYMAAVVWLKDRLPERADGARLSAEDASLVQRIRDGDESAFALLVERYGASMLRIAGMYARDRAVAEEVVQETWLRVLGALDRFEGRSSLKTWVFRILVNTAKTRAQREGRVIPFSSLQDPARVPEASVDADRFLADNHEQHPGGWASPPPELPEDRLIAAESAADRLVMGLLRACADAIVVGSGTLTAAPGSVWTPAQAFPDAAAGFAELRRRRRVATAGCQMALGEVRAA